MKEAEERTVIVIIITTDSQITEVDEPTQDKENNPATGEVTETDEVMEICAPVPTANANQTLTTQTLMPTSRIGCTNGRDPTATPTKPSEVTAGSPERGKVHGNKEGST